VISRRTVAAVLATGLIGTLTACSDDSNAVSPSDETTATLTKDNFALKIRQAQSDAGSAHVDATVESQGQSLRLEGDVDHLDTPQTPSFDFTAELGGKTLRMRVVDELLYISGAGLEGTGGKKWMKIDVSDSSNPFAQVFQAANPGNFTAYLEGVTRFEDKGSQIIDTVKTHHYDVTVDTAKMLASNPVFKGQDASTLGLPKAITSEVYVDQANRLVEIKVDLAATGAFEAQFSDYGESVDVEAPPADQVGTFDLGG
jgi:hypothetical protein